MNKIIKPYEENQMWKRIAKRYDRDETISMLHRKIADIETENGVLKSSLSEANYSLLVVTSEYKKLAYQKKTFSAKHYNLEIKKLKKQVHELLYQLEAHGCKIPEKYKK